VLENVKNVKPGMGHTGLTPTVDPLYATGEGVRFMGRKDKGEKKVKKKAKLSIKEKRKQKKQKKTS
jgi:hypothetical protein